MSDSRSIPVIAVDGGGTRCRVAYDDGRSTTVVETGPANASTDFESAARQVTEGLNVLSQRMNVDLSGLPAFVGLAGVVDAGIVDRLAAALPLSKARIADDRPAALRGALGRKDGVIAHCGTGSFFAAQIGGAMRFAGGWGSVLGDEASAHWIGKRALRIALDCADGLCPPSPLTDKLHADLGDAPGIVRFAGKATPADIGALARIVTNCASNNDAVATRILKEGAGEIARTLPLLGWTQGMAICLTGGLGPHYLPYLPEDMRAHVTPPEGEPLAGAIDLAREGAA
jgi:glucosamine kinase